MRFIPYYTVSYRGKFYPACVEFEIEDVDVDLMRKHGVITGVTPPETDQNSQAVNALFETEKPVRKAGRPRKHQ